MGKTLPAYQGSCHCGAIGFELRSGVPPINWSIRACQCSFCRAHGALSMSEPNGEIRFEIRDSTHVRRYRFGLRTADFLLCGHCGVYVGAVIATERGSFGIINLRTLSDPPDDFADPAAVDYDGEDTGARIARREEKWMAVTGIA
ncbi:MAG TPA: hypothetical protein VNQ14_07385 [Woeseiaceae bacterium]|nr:hypothetical protein [Woeseiaceae bacterium]